MRFTALFTVATYILLSSCGNSQKPADTSASDAISIAIDETFRPIMDEEMKVFSLQYPEAEMQPHYCSEVEALNLFLQDSIRMIVATRELNGKELETVKSHQLFVRSKRIATDGIALIVHGDSPDTLITVDEVKGIMEGRITRWEQLKKCLSKGKGELEIIFDHPQSSTVRYIEDSICGGKAIKGNAKAQQTNQAVIDYVAKTPHAIGIIGVDWLRNNADSTHLSFMDGIRVMSVSRSSVPEPGNSYQPLQYYLATGNYPFTRAVYMLTSDPRSRSFPLSFFYFVSDTQGQLIITKSSQLLPYMPVQYKEVHVYE